MKCIKILSMLIVFITFAGCNPDDDDNPGNNGGTSNFAENFGAEVSRDFVGQIVDTDNNPVQNATVKIGTASASTDVNGFFIINSASVHQRFAYVTATKAGYLDGSRSLVPTSGKNSVKIMLIAANPIATISSGETSEVALSSGTKVVFDGAFEDESGNQYTGDVSVAMYHLEASNPDLSKLMPGMLYAETENGDEASLQTFGMMNVDMRGSSGQKIQIANGHAAQISMKIDDSQLGTAPQTIPLWHFDETAGYWKEDGSASKQGGFYVGEVSHFSWWNCDAPFPTVNLQVTVNDSNGNPVSNALVSLSFAGSGYATSGWSNGEGLISGLVPANQTLTMQVFDDCGNAVSTSQIGPFATDTVLPDIVLSSAVQTVMIQGTLLQCDNSDVVNGYVTLNYSNNYSYVSVSNGSFSFTQLVCDTAQNFTLQGFDYDNLQQTDSIAYSYTAPVTNIGNLVVCDAVNEFVTYQIDTAPPVVLIQQINAGVGTMIIIGAQNGNQQSLYISGTVNTPGVYTTSDFYLEGSLGFVSENTVNDIVFTVSDIGSPGQYIDMTFNGTYFQNGATHTISGTAHVLRDQ